MKSRFHLAVLRRSAAIASALLLAVAALSSVSCSKKITDIDASLAPPGYPEGRPADALLMLYPDTPVPVSLVQDIGAPGVSIDDVLVSTENVYDLGPGAVIGTILDHSAASQYRIYRKQGVNGFEELSDFNVTPVRAWLAEQTELFRFEDQAPYAAPNRQYIGRGVVGGLLTASAPLTNVVNLTSGLVADSMTYRGNFVGGGVDTTRDSTFVMKWNRVEGAAGYWVNVTGFLPSVLSNVALIRAALPRPIIAERVAEHYLAYIPDVTPPPGKPMSQKLGDPLPAGSRLVLSRPGVNGAFYCVRISAVDANGQVLARIGSKGSYALASAGVSGFYKIFPLGAAVVQPTREPPPPDGLRYLADPEHPRALAPGEVQIISAHQLPPGLIR
ncbi:MAG: hypothetical protein HOP12_09405 [Candidatus Eisenbacteria bacterium]|uniref:Uncharacterized protein n=1 Tax=Eiseniibacteriota bacterium TaxID=2212470 RepID=A0A849SG85_UNCEI|nr:hypothetical protein [Candidatus Eisenbacteria bacterium]